MNTYCKLFVDSSLTSDEMIRLIMNMSSGANRGYHIESKSLDIHVIDNDDFDDIRRHGVEDGFLFYRYYLDIEPMLGVAEEEYVEAIRCLLMRIRAEGMRAVAACDFEDRLPPAPQTKGFTSM